MAKRTPREPISEAHVEFGHLVEGIRTAFPMTIQEADFDKSVWSGVESGKAHPTAGFIRYVADHLCKTDEQRANFLAEYEKLNERAKGKSTLDEQRPPVWVVAYDRLHILISSKMRPSSYDGFITFSRRFPMLPWLIVGAFVIVTIGIPGGVIGLLLYLVAKKHYPSLASPGSYLYVFTGILFSYYAMVLLMCLVYRLNRRALRRRSIGEAEEFPSDS